MALTLVLAGACARPPRHEPPAGYGAMSPSSRGAADGEPQAEPRILSAHFAIDDGPSLGGRDGMVLVFSTEVDPMTLEAESFSVVMKDGSRRTPERGVLAPASESDENRTVWLVGDFGDPKKNPPTHVTVFGQLYAEDGRLLRSLAAEVQQFEAPGTVVFAEHVSTREHTCPGSPGAIRTYWLDGLRDVDGSDLEKIRLVLINGDEVRPARYDDHRQPGDERSESTEDNVLDLCLDQDTRVQRVRIDAGLFADPSGHRSAAVDVVVAPGSEA